MVALYGNHSLGRTAVNKWCKSFREGRQTTSDHPRPGQANKVITNNSIASVNEMIQANRRIETREMSHELNLSKGTVHTIIHQHPGYSKVHAAWVPKHLNLDHQKRWMGFCPIRYVSTINSAQNCSTLTKLRKAIKNKRPGLLTRGVILLHDNIRPHVSQETQRILNTFRWKVLEHSPNM